MLRNVTASLLIGAGVIAAPLRGQRLSGPFVRLEAGSLNPKVLLQTTLAVGASTGWQLAGRDALLLRYLRQSQNRAGTDVGQHARSFLTANWEHAFGAGGLFRRQAMLRVGGGAVFRWLLRTAPVLDAGLEVRYGLTPHWSLVANIEDDLAALPHQVIQVCSFGNCSLVTFDRELEQNFGLIIAGEWRP
jgi:hypothetical protein